MSISPPNPFASHDAAMQRYQEQYSEPLNGKAGGAIIYSGTQYPAIINQFELRQILTEGGFSPRLMSRVIVRKSDVGNIFFRSGQNVVAIQAGGATYQCKIEAITDNITEYWLDLWARDEKA